MGLFKKLFTQTSEKVQPFPAPTSSANKTSEPVFLTDSDGPIPIEARIQSTQKGPSGLYPHEVLMLHYSERYTLNQKDFQQFWWWYGIENPLGLLEDLRRRGYLCEGGLQQSLANSKVSELKSACSALGLKATGKKQDLIERIQDASIPESDKLALFSNQYFALTEAGKEALSSEEYIPYIHSNPKSGLSIWNINEVVSSSSSPKWRDAIWKKMNELCIEHASNSDFGLYRNVRSEMAAFLTEEERYSDALNMLIEVEFDDINGCTNNFSESHKDMYIRDLAPYSESLMKSAPGIISQLFDLAKKSDLSDEALWDRITSRNLEGTTPLYIFTMKECAEIVFFERDGNTEMLEKLYSLAQKRMIS